MDNFQALVTLAPWTLIAQICNLFITVFVMKKFLFGRIEAILVKRQQMVDAEVCEAEEAKQAAVTMKTEYEERLASAKAEAAQLVQDATRTASLRGEELLSEAQTQVAALKTKADADIAQQKKKAVNEIKDEIGGIAMDIASKVIERELNAKDHEALIEEFIQNVGDAS